MLALCIPRQGHAGANQPPIKPISIAVSAAAGPSASSGTAVMRCQGCRPHHQRAQNPHSPRPEPGATLPTVSFFEGFRTPAPCSLSDTTDVSRRGIARIAAGKADVPPDLAEPLRHATMLIANLR